MTKSHQADHDELRRLALLEAEKEFLEDVLPCPPFSGTWIGITADELRMTLFRVALRFHRDAKKKQLVKLLKAINDAELNVDDGEKASQSFLDKHGNDRDQYWELRSDRSPEENLVELMFSRKQRPRFYYSVEELCKYLDEQSAQEFREAVGPCLQLPKRPLRLCRPISGLMRAPCQR